MQKNTSITIGKHFEAFIAQKVNTGQFATTSEVVRAGLRLLEERDIKLNALRKALIDGEKSGFAEYSLNGLMNELDKESIG